MWAHLRMLPDKLNPLPLDVPLRSTQIPKNLLLLILLYETPLDFVYLLQTQWEQGYCTVPVKKYVRYLL